MTIFPILLPNEIAYHIFQEYFIAINGMNSSTLVIHAVPIFKDNYIWLIRESVTNKVIAIDPGEAHTLQNFITTNHLDLAAILITHHHADHTNGIQELINHSPVPVYGPNNPSIRGITNPVQEPDTIVFPFLAEPFSVLNTPGHTLDHISYLFSGMLFCGDTLFSAGCGRLFEGTAEQLFHSLQKIAALPDDTKIYCTHEYTLQNLLFAQAVEPKNPNIQTKIDQVKVLRANNQPSLPSCLRNEKKFNPFLRCNNKEIIASVERQVGFKLDNIIDVFKQLREWKNNF